MPKSIYVQFLLEQPKSNLHYLNRLIKLLNHFISIEPLKKTKGFEDHHIVPRSWKPEWDKVPENHLRVPAKAHYVIHHLMWKAFPKNHDMAKAFHMLTCRLHEKVTSRVFVSLRKIYSQITRENNLKRVIEGTHPWLNGETSRNTQIRKLKDGTHLFLNHEFQSQNSLRRVANGTHNFLGGEIVKAKVKDGTHLFLNHEFQSQNSLRRVANGTHPSQIKKSCPHCKKEVDVCNYSRYHGDKCKFFLPF